MKPRPKTTLKSQTSASTTETRSQRNSRRKQTEESLREYQAMLSTAEEVAKIGGWKWDLRTKKVTWSREMFHLFGVEPDQFDGDLSRIIAERIHPDDAAAVEESNRKVLEESNAVPLSYRIVLPDGTEKTVWAQGQLVRDETGQPVALMGFVQDITDRVHAEQERAWLASFPEQNPNPVVEIDLTGSVHYMNTAAQQKFPDMRTLGFNHPWLKGLESVPGKFEEGMSAQQREVEIDNRWYSQSTFLVPGKARLRIYGLDITERKKSEQKVIQLKRLYATLSQVNQMIVRVKERDELFQTICDVAVQFGEFALAWVGLLDAETGDLWPIAAKGVNLKHWPFPIVNIHKGEHTQALTATAIRTSNVMTSKNVQIDARMRSFGKSLQLYPYRSAAAIPIELRGANIGVLGLFSYEEGLFDDPEEISLLAEMGLDISFALDNMENEKERQKMETALRQNEENFSKTFRSSPAALLITRLQDGQIIEVNDAYCTVVGYSRGELIGHKTTEFNIFIRESDRKVIVAQLMAKGSVRDFDSAIRHRSGAIKHVVAAQELISFNGETSIITHLLDITERKQAEEARAQLAAIVESSGDAIIGKTLDGIITSWNKGAEDIYGYLAEEVIGRSISIIIPPDLSDELSALLDQLKRGNAINRYETVRLRKDGRPIDVSLTISPIRNAQGIPTGASTIARDITDRRQAEQALRESEERFRLLFENNHTAMMLIDPASGSIRDANVAAAEFYGYPLSELRALNIQDLNQLTPEQLHAERTRALHEERDYFRSQHRLASGEIRSVEVYSAPMEVDGTTLLFSIINDITERVRSEKKILQLKRLYATLSQVNQMIIRVKDQDELFQTICDVAVQFGEFSVAWIGIVETSSGDVRPSFAAGMDVKNWFLPIVNIHSGPLSQGLVSRALHTSRVTFSEDLQADPHLQVLRGPLQEHGFHASAVIPIQLRNTAIGTLTLISPEIGLFKDREEARLLEEMGLDISFALDTMENEKERKQAVETINRNEHILRLFVEHTPASIAMFDRDMRYIIASQRYLIDYDLPPQNLTGRSHYEVFPEIPERWKEIHRRCLAGAVEKAEEDPFPRADGRLDWVRWEIHPWYEEAGRIGGIILFSEVITERKRIQDELRLLNSDLERRVLERTMELSQANRAKDEFLANMSHELRTPLNTVLGLSETLLEQRRGVLNEKQVQSLELISASGQHLLGLINDILEIAKVDAGKLQLHPGMVSLKELCESSLNFIKELALKKSIDVEFDNETSISTFWADAQRLKQILINLLTNAVKFTPERGRVNLGVSTNDEGDQILFSVTDTGIGIQPGDLQKLFTPFTQLDSSLARQYTGTGLGLALVQKLTELHGGSVHVESDPGRGSRFTIVLPLFQGDQEKAEPENGIESARAEPNPATAPKERGRILLAEDNEINADMMQEYLKAQGYAVLTAHNGEEVLTKAAQFAPDLILMDIQMPKMDGLEATRQLRADPRFVSIPIIALTALAMPGDRERCFAAGVNEYMSKPVSLRMLVKTIRSLLRKPA